MSKFKARGGDGTPNIFPALPMIARLHKEYPETAVIILSQHIIPSVVHEGVGYDNLKGYLLKSDNITAAILRCKELGIISNEPGMKGR